MRQEELKTMSEGISTLVEMARLEENGKENVIESLSHSYDEFKEGQKDIIEFVKNWDDEDENCKEFLSAIEYDMDNYSVEGLRDSIKFIHEKTSKADVDLGSEGYIESFVFTVLIEAFESIEDIYKRYPKYDEYKEEIMKCKKFITSKV